MIPGSANPLLLASAAPSYQIERSLRFNNLDSAYLARTPATTGNRLTYTFSCWTKRVKLSTQQQGLFQSYVTTTRLTGIIFNATDTLMFQDYDQGQNYNSTWSTNAVFRDPSAWYHVVLSVDFTQAAAADAVKIYVNGLQQALTFSTNGFGPYVQNRDTYINLATVPHHIGRRSSSPYLDGYLADIYFVDGQALDHASFGGFDVNGVWQPKAYTGSYGTNGFHLPFSDNSTTAALGTDASGNGNNWGVINISTTAGVGNDSLVDTPTNYGEDTGVGGEVRGNYCTWNPLDKGSSLALANGNLDTSSNTTVWGTVRGTIGIGSGKYYWEITYTAAISNANVMIGIGDSSMSLTTYVGSTSAGRAYYSINGVKYPEGVAYGSSYTQNDVIGVALDMDAGTLTFYRNGVSQGQSHGGLTGVWFPALSTYGTVSTALNAGQRPFAYTAPSGYKALCTANLPDPVVARPSTAMAARLYTGNGGTQTISGLGFSPDLVWLKSRSNFGEHVLYDPVRGAAKKVYITNGPEQNDPSGLTAFTSDGFSLGSAADANNAGTSYVAWTWDAGSSTVSNTDGSITSSVRTNPSTGLSIVTYTGTGTTATVGHGLGVAPDLIICKNLDSNIYWSVYHRPSGSTGFFILSSDAAYNSSTMWNPAPTSTTLNFDSSGFGANNGSGHRHIAYCFASVDGFSSFGRYSGTGVADGAFVYTGFRPKFLILKRHSVAGHWMTWDSSRWTYNAQGPFLRLNETQVEINGTYVDFLSNGFKLRTTSVALNGSGDTYAYIAFAGNPFKYARAR